VAVTQGRRPRTVALGIGAFLIQVFPRPISFYASLIAAIPAAAHLVVFIFLVGADPRIFITSYAFESGAMFATLVLFALALRPRNGA
jgi:hypothetical protein